MILAGENYISDSALEKETEETFGRFDSPWFDDDRKSLLLRSRGDAKYYLDKKQPKNINIISKSDTESEMLFYYYDDREALTFVKRWLPDIQILDNPQLDKKLQNILKEYLQK